VTKNHRSNQEINKPVESCIGNRRIFARVLIAAILVSAFAGCVRQSGGSGSSAGKSSGSGCPKSSQSKPLSGTFECDLWSMEVSTGSFVSDDVVYGASSANDIIAGKVWIAVTINATYKGEGASSSNDICDTWNDACGLIGKNNVMYPVDWIADYRGVGLESDFGPPFYLSSDLAMPRKGGKLRAAMWFHVDSGDSDLVLALDMSNDSSKSDPAAWIDVSNDRKS